MAEMGQEERFRPCRLSVRSRLRERTLAGTHSNDEDAAMD